MVSQLIPAQLDALQQEAVYVTHLLVYSLQPDLKNVGLAVPPFRDYFHPVQIEASSVLRKLIDACLQPSQPASQEQYQEDYNHKAETTAWVITPRTTVRPRWKSSYQQQH
jgi:hypothetical protein